MGCWLFAGSGAALLPTGSAAGQLIQWNLEPRGRFVQQIIRIAQIKPEWACLGVFNRTTGGIEGSNWVLSAKWGNECSEAEAVRTTDLEFKSQDKGVVFPNSIDSDGVSVGTG